MASAVADPDPVLYYEHIALYRDPRIRQVIGDDPPAPIPLGRSALRRAGGDLVMISYGAFVHAGLRVAERDRKSTRLNSSHANISTLSLHDALPIYGVGGRGSRSRVVLRAHRALSRSADQASHWRRPAGADSSRPFGAAARRRRSGHDFLWRIRARRPARRRARSEEHTSELQSRQYLHSFPTRRSSDLWRRRSRIPIPCCITSTSRSIEIRGSGKSLATTRRRRFLSAVRRCGAPAAIWS